MNIHSFKLSNEHFLPVIALYRAIPWRALFFTVLAIVAGWYWGKHFVAHGLLASQGLLIICLAGFVLPYLFLPKRIADKIIGPHDLFALVGLAGSWCVGIYQATFDQASLVTATIFAVFLVLGLIWYVVTKQEEIERCLMREQHHGAD